MLGIGVTGAEHCSGLNSVPALQKRGLTLCAVPCARVKPHMEQRRLKAVSEPLGQALLGSLGFAC